MTCRSICLVHVGCMRNRKQYDLRCLCGVRVYERYEALWAEYLCRTSVTHESYKTVRVGVSVWYNWGCVRGMEQYVLRSLPGITGYA